MLTPLAKFARAAGRASRAVHARSDHAGHRAGRARTGEAEHREAGDLCCVVTATNEFITRPIAQAFGVDNADRLRSGNRRRRAAFGLHRPPTGTPSYKEGKIVRTEAWLASLGKSWSDFERSYFYSDSHNDIPLLEKVTDPIATNPDDTLRAHAQANGWRILELFQPT
jgi:phosphoserine phosphatase